MDQMEGQIASAKIGMARLSSPQLYWVLGQNDFTLDINNPQEPQNSLPGKQSSKTTDLWSHSFTLCKQTD
jgi:hypothetical protein